MNDIPDIYKQYGEDVHRMLNSDILKNAREALFKNPGLFMINCMLEMMACGYFTIHHKQALDGMYAEHGFKDKYGINTMVLPKTNDHFIILQDKIILPFTEEEFPIKIIESEFERGIVVEFSSVDFLKFDALYMDAIRSVV